MKRSKKAALVLTVPVATLLIAGCEKEVQGMVYSNPEECSAGGWNTEQCEAEYAEAKALHPQVAPKYVSKEECEADFGDGKCETAPQQTTSGHSVFMPMMMGYLAGQMMNRGASFQQPGAASAGTNTAATGTKAAAAGASVPTQPLYKSRDDRGTYRTAHNTPVAKGTGPVSLKPSQMQPRAGGLVRRGGFGHQAAMRNSYGG
ncbi:DUF1190 domain-containing protein [Microbulbifer bruguierae]|uniref:DUF1190 domain-containing protein n=1 Tax=Microbulbifer bruguierae TaxID=3029061 RepID=A0ABY8NG71_9GAMM|nr:DUF1190 domain-containing protein [Microbulbifer bruguierae]WGL17803.1 DUF1190 domain-containing protein [Microbulbifer bruguierae]